MGSWTPPRAHVVLHIPMPLPPLGIPSEPPEQPLLSSDSQAARTTTKTHPSGASRTAFEAVPGPAQFKLRKLEA
eukprot:118949-Alexandrium_andersonii.AAC.1